MITKSELVDLQTRYGCDKNIADSLNMHRSSVTKLRKKFNIKPATFKKKSLKLSSTQSKKTISDKLICKLRDENTYLRSIKRDNFRHINDIETYYKKMIKLLKKTSFKKNIVIHKPSKTSNSIGIIKLADLHMNEWAIDNNFEVIAKDLQKFAYEAKCYFNSKKIKKIVFVMLGDMINSDRRAGEKTAMITNRVCASNIAQQLIAHFLLDLNKDFNITVAHVTGNESRVDKDWNWEKLHALNNYDTAIFLGLNALLSGSKGIKFIFADVRELLMTIATKKILFVHGFNRKNTDSYINKYAKQKKVILDYVFQGHSHVTEISDWGAKSSSGSTGSDWVRHQLNAVSKKAQLCTIISSDGDINVLRVDLNNSNNYKGYKFNIPYPDIYYSKKENKHDYKDITINI